MGAKHIIILILIVFLITSCSADKTKPVVTSADAGQSSAVQESAAQENNENIVQDAETETAQTEETQEENQSEEEEQSAQGTHEIIIKDLKLVPQTLTVNLGDTVIWRDEDTSEGDDTKHYIAAHSNEFRSSVLYNGDSFSHTFNKTGKFTYIDPIYKEKNAMRGTIIVE